MRSPTRLLVTLSILAATLALPALAAADEPPADPASARVEVGGDLTVVHDPEIAQEGGTTYLYSTGPGLPIRRSTDGRTWELVGRVFGPESLPAWAATQVPEAIDPWAPALERFGGQWHLYYSVSVFGTSSSAIGHATNPTLDPDDPTYEWTDHGRVVTSDAVPLDPGIEAEWNAIDPAVAVDGDQVWLAWGSFHGGIKLRELDPATGAPLADGAVHTLARRVPWFFGVEAAHLEHRDGWWYLVTSWNFCCRGADSNYEVRVGRSRDVTGPYVDRDGQPLTEGGGTLLLAGYGDPRGPGHSSMLVEGDEWVLVHHFYDAAAAGIATLGMHRVTWTADGWPVIGHTPRPPETSTTTAPPTTAPNPLTPARGASGVAPAVRPSATAAAAPRFTG